MTAITYFPLSKLSLWDGNVRKTDIHAGIDELAASIAAHGLLQSLVVRKGKRGKLDIVAGQRRFLALQMLAQAGKIDKAFMVPCLIAEEGVEAAELSLAENAVRAPMHPADQFEAFRQLIDNGSSVADVAARFGVSDTVVAKRMKLGRLSPVILGAYRVGEIDLEEAQAFALSDDHAAQERVFAELSPWSRNPHTIRDLLTDGEVSTNDKRVRFVGIEAYRQAGGAIRQDLFDDAGSGYILDISLLERLVAEKFNASAADIRAEGWSWVEIIPGADWKTFNAFKRVYAERAPLSDADETELERLASEYDDLADTEDADEDRLAQLQERMDALEAKRMSWSPEVVATAGAVLSLDHRGDLQIERGLVRKQDAHKLATDDNAAGTNGSSRNERSDSLSSRLVEDLTAQYSAAIGAELIRRPDIALAAVVYTLALDAIPVSYSAESCLKLSAASPRLKSAMAQPELSKSLAVVEHEFERIGDHLPGDPTALWNWLLSQSRDQLLDLLAIIAAGSIDAVQRKTDRPDASRLIHAKSLAAALQLDMSNWFQPSAQNYFAHVKRSQILAAIDEANGSHGPALDKLKKSELAQRAEQLLAGKSWLPEPLRAAVNDNDADLKSEAAE